MIKLHLPFENLICFILLLITVSGCDQRKFLETITPPEDDKLAREFIERLRTNDSDYIISRIDRSVWGENPRQTIMEMYEYVDHASPKNIELISCYIRYFESTNQAGKKYTDLSYQIEFPASWYTANIVICTTDGLKELYGFRINKIPASLKEINRFTFEGKGLLPYVMLFVAILIPCFILFTLGLCIFTKVKYKWLWIIFILLGFGKVTYNWTTGYILFHINFNIQLLGSGIVKSGLYAPWIITFSFPVGAILFLILRNKLRIPKRSQS